MYAMHLILFFSYFHDPYHIAFNLTEGMKRDKKYKIASLSFALDIFLTLDIFIHLVTAYQTDVKEETDLFQIIKNYVLHGSFVLDVFSTIPMLILPQTSQWFFLKFLRFIHIQQVYGTISTAVQYILSRMSFDKSTTEKASTILDMVTYLFSAIHILGCLWIGIGFAVECSWLEAEGGGCNDGNKSVIPDRDNEIYIQAIYFIITTLTTLGYGDFKGYTSPEYLF